MNGRQARRRRAQARARFIPRPPAVELSASTRALVARIARAADDDGAPLRDAPPADEPLADEEPW